MHLKLLFSLFTLCFMTDTGGAGDGAGDESGDTHDDNPPHDDKTDKTGAGKGDDGSDDDLEGLKNALKAERTRAKNADRDVKALRTELETIKNAGKTDEEKREADLKDAQTRADAAETRLKTANARVAVTDAATKTNAISVNAVFALIRDGLEYDDDGEPTNVDDLIAKARKDEPQLFRAAAGSGDGGKQTSTKKPDVAPGYARMAQAYNTDSKTAVRST